MADFQTVMDHIAQVVGGTNVGASQPRFFSGDQVLDGTGLQPGAGYPTFKGCYSAPPEAFEDLPIGVVLPGPFEVGGPLNRDVYVQGEELNVDDLRVLILITRIDSETDITNLMPYRDLMPAAFAAKMSAFSTANILQAMVRGGKPVQVEWPTGYRYSGWEFTVRVTRMISRSYAA